MDSLRICTQDQRKEHEERGSQGAGHRGRRLGAAEGMGALIKEKEQSRQKKSRLDNLPSLQIEVSRESSSGSEAES